MQTGSPVRCVRKSRPVEPSGRTAHSFLTAAGTTNPRQARPRRDRCQPPAEGPQLTRPRYQFVYRLVAALVPQHLVGLALVAYYVGVCQKRPKGRRGEGSGYNITGLIPHDPPGRHPRLTSWEGATTADVIDATPFATLGLRARSEASWPDAHRSGERDR
jgi:hypothetical protein